MVQDLIDEIPAGDEELYLGTTPESVTYPGRLTVPWRDFERRLQVALTDAIAAAAGSPAFSAILMCCFGELVHREDDADLRFGIFGLTEGGYLLAARDVRDVPPGHRLLLASDRLPWWPDFMALMAAVQRRDVPGGDEWKERAEEQFHVCGLKVLRRVFPGLDGRTYAGHTNETCEELTNRSRFLVGSR